MAPSTGQPIATLVTVVDKGMPNLGAGHALIARIQSLEEHALALQAAFRSDALKREAGIVLTTLQMAEASLRGSPDASAVMEAEAIIESVSQRLSGLGRAP
jgi:hypothetical protein